MHGIDGVGRSQRMRTRKPREPDDSVQSRLVERPTHASSTDFPLVITAIPINAAQRRVAFGVMIAIAFIELASAPFAHLPVAHIDSFVPVLQSVMSILHLLTAVLLFSQYSVWPRFATLSIASGYVFSGLFAFVQTLTYPGAYSTGILIGNDDTSVWLFALWQTTFALASIIYTLTKDGNEALPSTRSPTMGIVIAVASVIAAVGGLTWLVLTSSAYLPRFFIGDGQVDVVMLFRLNIYLWSLNSIALALLFFRRRTVLDLWLIVTLFAWWPIYLVPMYFTLVRFSIGWYIARSLAVLASSVLLAILMGETTLIYARLANSIRLLCRERAERLASVEAATSAMAYEIRQPLAGIANMGSAGLDWLKATPANIERTRACLAAVMDASQHADEIISGIGGLFRRAPNERTRFQVNEVCRDVVKLGQNDILANGISVRFRCQDDLPLINADHTQIQQVILNLVRNAIDAVSNRPANERRLLLVTRSNGKSLISVCIRDSGPGISNDVRNRIFEPFYTTKTNSMGLGLAVCRKIVEQHEGRLRLAETSSHGSTFEVVLPVG